MLLQIDASRAGIIKSHRPAHFLETNLALFAVVDVDDILCARHLYAQRTGKRTVKPMTVCRGRSVVVVTVAKSEYRIDGDRKLRVTRSGGGLIASGRTLFLQV